MQFSTIDRTENTALLVTSPGPSEGKSLTAANLAVVIAQAGHRVLVVDSDLRRPVMHKIFGVDNHTGLTEFMRSTKISELDESVEAGLETVIHNTAVDGLCVMTSGPIPPNPSELLSSNTYHLLLDALKKHFDYIVVDSPPSLVVTDAIVLSTRVDGVLLVIDADSTQRGQLRQSADRLREVNANILGVVVNRLSAKTDGYYDYYHYYYYQKSGDGSYAYTSGSTRSADRKTSPFKRRTSSSPKPHSSGQG